MSPYIQHRNTAMQQPDPNIAERFWFQIRDVLLSPKNPTEGLALCTQIEANLRREAVRCFYTDDTERFLQEPLPGDAKTGRSTVYVFSDDSALFFGDTWRNGEWVGPVFGMWRKPPSDNIVPIEEAPRGSPVLLEEPIEEESDEKTSVTNSGTEESTAEYQIEIDVHCVHKVRASSGDEAYSLAVRLTHEISEHMPKMTFMGPHHLERDIGVGLAAVKREDGCDLIA